MHERRRREAGVPRTARLAVGGPAGETTDFGADYKLSPLERMLLTAAVCTEMSAPPTGRALLLGGGSAMALDVQGGYRAVCGRSIDGYKATTKWQAAVCEGQGRAPATEREEGGRFFPKDFKKIETPTAVAIFPAEMSEWPPRSYVDRMFNITQWTEMPRGGHFAALEEPELLVNDLVKFSRMVR